MHPIRTTMIGSYPKPEYLKIPDWRNTDVSVFVKEFVRYTKEKTPQNAAEEAKGVRDVLSLQVEAGVDFPTDGEVKRGDYISYHCCHLDGIDSNNLEELSCRGGAYSYWAPVVRSRIEPRQKFLAGEAREAGRHLPQNRELKVTLPGPTTVRDTIKNDFYDSEDKYLADLSRAINAEILDLAASGVKHIQVDEPVFARNPSFALSKGLKYLNACFDGVYGEYPDVTLYVHICCGYPSSLDNEKAYTRADASAYFELLAVMDGADNQYHYICLEDAHRQNDLSLFTLFRNKGVVLGTVTIASTTVETVEGIVERIEEVAAATPSKKVMVSPDCGMMMLPWDIAGQKVRNMCEAVRIVNDRRVAEAG